MGPTPKVLTPARQCNLIVNHPWIALYSQHSLAATRKAAQNGVPEPVVTTFPSAIPASCINFGDAPTRYQSDGCCSFRSDLVSEHRAALQKAATITSSMSLDLRVAQLLFFTPLKTSPSYRRLMISNASHPAGSLRSSRTMYCYHTGRCRRRPEVGCDGDHFLVGGCASELVAFRHVRLQISEQSMSLRSWKFRDAGIVCFFARQEDYSLFGGQKNAAEW